jgi:hypothetical protein
MGTESRERSLRCVTCEVDIVGTPTIHVGLPFCCAGCVVGGPCTCSYEAEPDDGLTVRHCIDIAGVIDDRRLGGPRERAA